MVEDEVAEDNRIGVMQQPVMAATTERMELVDVVARIIHEDVVDAHGTMIKQVKTPIKLELVAPEALELEVQEAEAVEVDQEEEIEAMPMSQEVEEDEAEVDAETMKNHKKLSINRTQKIATVTSAASKKL